MKSHSRRRAAYLDGLPKFTYGLEGKLFGLIGEPIALAHKVVRSKFENVVTTVTEPYCIRHVYHTQRYISYIDIDEKAQLNSFPWDQQANTQLFGLMPPTTRRRYDFQVDLIEDPDGKLTSFKFALQVS